MDDLTETEEATLKEFRIDVQDILRPEHDDWFLLRWLIARNFDKERAENMLRKHMKLQKLYGFETIFVDYDPPEVFKKFTNWNVLGYDKEGSPILCMLPGISDLKGFVYSSTLFDCSKYIAYMVEYAISKVSCENIKKHQNARKISVIIDLDGLKLSQVADKNVVKYFLDLVQLYEPNYPEVLKRIFVINAPSFSYYLFSLVKPFLNSVIIEKIRVYHTEYWKEDLLKEIDADVLPAFLGGTRTDTDGNPKCLSLFNWKTTIPTSYYLLNKDLSLKNEPGMTFVNILQRSYFNDNFQIKATGSGINWVFVTKGYNIGFGLFYNNEAIMSPVLGQKTSKKEFKNNLYEALIPTEIVESHIIPQRGEMICEKPGTYILHFDNTFSWLTPKDLSYKVEIIPPSKVENGNKNFQLK